MGDNSSDPENPTVIFIVGDGVHLQKQLSYSAKKKGLSSRALSALLGEVSIMVHD